MELIPYQDIEKMGTAVAKSNLFGVKTVEQAVALMLIAQAYGKHPAIAAMEYNIISGRPAKKAESMLASFQEAGGKVRWIELTDKKAKAEFSHPQGGTLELEWTIEMAKSAGLIDKEYSNYKKYPRAMLRSRVVAEGVRAVYPAATGGMLSKEEAEDIAEAPTDATKSRLDNIIDAEHEVKEDVKKEEVKKTEVVKEKDKVKKETKKDSSKDLPVSNETAVSSEQLPKNHKTIVGLIDNTIQGDNGEIVCYKTATVNHPDTGKPALKYSFLIDGKRYGTFDSDMAYKILECIDKRILVKFEFKERDTGKAIMNDIISFKQAVAGKDYPVE